MAVAGQSALVFALLGLVPWPAGPWTRASDESGFSAAQQVRTYAVDVGLVRLSVTARNAKGELVHDLRPEEFQVFEEGIGQQVARFGHHEAPISVVVLVDRSNSMDGDKLMHAQDGVVNFVRALRAQDEIRLVSFGTTLQTLGDFGLDAPSLERATRRIRTQISTRLYDAVVEGARAIASPGRNEKRALLILSDGQDTSSDATPEEAVEAVRQAGVPVYAIGIEMGDDDDAYDPTWSRARRSGESALGPGAIWMRLAPTRQAPPRSSASIEALRPLTDGTGGWTYPIVAARRCKEVCLRVADELRNQYLLGYMPSTGATDGGWRTVTVRTSRPGVTLTTRQGYYSAPP